MLEGANASEDIARIEEMRMVDCFIVFLLKNFACGVVKIYFGDYLCIEGKVHVVANPGLVLVR